MNTARTIKIFKQIQKEDIAFEEKKKDVGGTFCCECYNNKPTGLFPFWHRFARTLCEDCAKEYAKFLKGLGAYDDIP